MRRLKHAIGKVARKLGDPDDFGKRLDRVYNTVFAVAWVVFAFSALRGGIKSEALYDNTLGEPFYRAEQTQDAGEIADYLEEGIAGVEAAGLTTGHAVTIGQPRPSNDTAVYTASLRTLIARAREVDALDHKSEAYQLGLKDVKDRVDTADTDLYFRRWTRLNGWLGATRRSFAWAAWHSLLALIAGVAFGLATEEALGWLQKRAYGWEGNEATA